MKQSRSRYCGNKGFIDSYASKPPSFPYKAGRPRDNLCSRCDSHNRRFQSL